MAPRFLGPKDINLFKDISEEMVHQVMDINVLLYKLDQVNTQANVYGQSQRRMYKQPITIPCVIQHQPQNLIYDRTIQYQRNADFKFLKSSLQSANIYPEIGDIVFWRNMNWEINIVKGQQLIGGRTDLQWSVVCSASIVSINKVKTIADEPIKDAGNKRTIQRKSSVYQR